MPADTSEHASVYSLSVLLGGQPSSLGISHGRSFDTCSTSQEAPTEAT